MGKIFKSDDTSLISFLLTQQDIVLLDISQDRPRHFIFTLSNPEKCADLKNQYLNNALAPARELFSNREMLIAEIKTREREGDKDYEQAG